MAPQKPKAVAEFGDFQTPQSLAALAVQTLNNRGFSPLSVIEPTCGQGSFLIEAQKVFTSVRQLVGVDINGNHLDVLRQRIAEDNLPVAPQLFHEDFFLLDWQEVLSSVSDPVLILGNPPWVTSSELSTLQSTNLPPKLNFQGYSGLEALTGKSNFDISEWMLLQYIQWLQGRTGTIAVLCKTSVARKVLYYVWKHLHPVARASIYKFNASHYFSVSVDACFFVLDLGGAIVSSNCEIYADIHDTYPRDVIGYDDGILVSNSVMYTDWKWLRGKEQHYIWRSGIKHDAAKVMEVEREGSGYRNGNKDRIFLEDTYLYPLYKSSDIGNGRTQFCRKYVLVPQHYVGEDTASIKQVAPKTWEYLQANAEALSKRASSVYQGRPPFSIFGVGDYTFTDWKVAISGFYKRLRFEVVGPVENRPAVFDDTVYFIACYSEAEARFIAGLLNSQAAGEFLDSMIFWEEKRPITIEILKRLDLRALAQYLDQEAAYQHYVLERPNVLSTIATNTKQVAKVQPTLF